MDGLPKRKPARLEKWDYSSAGAYFVTVCTRGKEMLLGAVVGGGVYDAPQIHLTAHGKVVQDVLRQIREYKMVKVEKAVIMPNHIHLLLFVRESGRSGSSQAPNPTNAAVPQFVSLLKRRCNRLCGENLWQRSYHDHIIRHEADDQRIWTYIDTNPAKWREDCFYSK